MPHVPGRRAGCTRRALQGARQGGTAGPPAQRAPLPARRVCAAPPHPHLLLVDLASDHVGLPESVMICKALHDRRPC